MKDIEATELRCGAMIRGLNDDLQALIDHLRSGDPISQTLRNDLANALDPDNKLTAVHLKKTYRRRGFVKKRQGIFRRMRALKGAMRAAELKDTSGWKMNEAIVPHVTKETGITRNEIYEGIATLGEIKKYEAKLLELAGGSWKNIVFSDLKEYEDGHISEDEFKRRCAERAKSRET